MGTIKIEEIHTLDSLRILHLVERSKDEGFKHMARLVNEYQSGENTFSKEGEVLLLALDGEQIIGICGLNQDPYVNEKNRGRIRRLYVLPEYRRLGIGRRLTEEVIQQGKKHFRILVLKTDNPKADHFYKSLGFTEVIGIEDISHYIEINSITI